MQNNYNPYGYGYNPTPSYYSQPRTNQYAFVNGLDGAKSYPMQPNRMVMLMDNDNPIIFKKISDNYGKTTLDIFKMVQISEDELRGINNPPMPEYALKSDLEALMKRIDELTNKKDGA